MIRWNLDKTQTFRKDKSHPLNQLRIQRPAMEYGNLRPLFKLAVEMRATIFQLYKDLIWQKTN